MQNSTLHLALIDTRNATFLGATKGFDCNEAHIYPKPSSENVQKLIILGAQDVPDEVAHWLPLLRALFFTNPTSIH